MRKVIVFVASHDADTVRDAITRTGNGRLGNYMESVSGTVTAGFGVLRAIAERKIEFACDDDTFSAIVTAINDTVPSYSATVDSWPLESAAFAR